MKKLYKLDGAIMKTENPNNRLYTFFGTLKVLSNPKGIPIDNENVCLRGSTIRNIEWMVGIIVFTGRDTKVMMNSQAPPSKRSNVERRTNTYLTAIFGILFFISGLCTLLTISTAYYDTERAEFFSGQENLFSLLSVFTFLILYNGLVPISLYVTMDMVRMI